MQALPCREGCNKCSILFLYSVQLNTGQLNSSDAGNDLNVERAWLQGLTGCGTVVAVVDDGKVAR